MDHYSHSHVFYWSIQSLKKSIKTHYVWECGPFEMFTSECFHFVSYRLYVAVMVNTVAQKTPNVRSPKENASGELEKCWTGFRKSQHWWDPKMWFVLMVSRNARLDRHVVNWPQEIMDAVLYQRYRTLFLSFSSLWQNVGSFCYTFSTWKYVSLVKVFNKRRLALFTIHSKHLYGPEFYGFSI